MTTSAEQYRALVARLEAIEESPISAVAGAASDAYQDVSKGVSNLVRNVSSPQAQQSLANSAKDLFMNLYKISTPGINAEILQFLIKNKNQLSQPTQDVLQQFTDKNPGQHPKAGDNFKAPMPDTDSPKAGNNTWSGPATPAPMRDPRQSTGTSQGAPMRDPTQYGSSNIRGM